MQQHSVSAINAFCQLYFIFATNILFENSIMPCHMYRRSDNIVFSGNNTFKDFLKSSNRSLLIVKDGFFWPFKGCH